MAVLPQYLWLVVVGALGSFGFGYGTGSNDVANAFGTSVGAKTLTLRQAVLLASVFEFIGALLLGRVVTSTIAGGIADVNTFAREPEVYAYGMAVALGVCTFWQILSSYLELNTSSTHSIIGAIIGFSFAYSGPSAVKWNTPDPNSFPPYKGVVPIVVSWIVSPVFTGAMAATIFLICRTLVLRHPNSTNRAFWVLPPLTLVTTYISIFFVFTKGAKKQLSKNSNWTDAKSAWVTAIIAGGCFVVAAVVAVPILYRRAHRKFAESNQQRLEATLASKAAKASPSSSLSKSTPSGSASPDIASPPSGSGSGSTDIEGAPALVSQSVGSFGHVSFGEPDNYDDMPPWRARITKAYYTMKRMLLYGTEVDIHKCVETDDLIAAIHRNAEVFEPKTEYVFSYLQVFSAICVVFAHGAGEVGYMAGPLTTIWDVYRNGRLSSSVQAPVWIVLIGALSLVLGLATYGYKVTRAMGVRLSKLSPTRGFAAELATATVILICSQYGLPTSSSQCITGGIIGVGLLEGRAGVNWTFLGRQFASWVATLFVTGFLTAAIFAQGIYAPGKTPGKAQITYEDRIANLTKHMTNSFQQQLASYNASATAGLIPTLTPAKLAQLNATAAKFGSQAVYLASPKQQTVYPDHLLEQLYGALALYQATSVLSVGQLQVQPGSPVCSPSAPAEISAGAQAACPAPNLVPAGYIPPAAKNATRA